MVLVKIETDYVKSRMLRTVLVKFMQIVKSRVLRTISVKLR